MGKKKKVADGQPFNEVRFNVCLACPRFFKPTGQCKECGCFMRIKTRLKFAECPIGKWGKEN